MNREIKFRAFDDGKMLTMPTDTNFVLSRFFGFLRDDAIIMQYTGLKDKNGKEIYEGDITDEGLVIFHNEYLGFFVKNDYEEEQLRPLYDFAFLEIIGNVYETPQLLNP